jgi:hypothetical protein
VPYSEAYWCQPVLTLHKTDPKDYEHLWRWEFSRRQADVSRNFNNKQENMQEMLTGFTRRLCCTVTSMSSVIWPW